MTETIEQLFADIEAEISSPPVGADLEAADDAELVKRYTRAKSRCADELATVKAEYERITGMLLRRDEALENWLGHAVRGALARLTAGAKRKSLNTLYGTVGLRRHKPRVRWEPQFEERIIQWCQEHGIPLSTPAPKAPPPKPLKEELVKAVQAGAVIPGIVFEDEGEDYYFKAHKENADVGGDLQEVSENDNF